MSKYLLCCLLALSAILGFNSCDDDNAPFDPLENERQISQLTGWETEVFKEQHSIQFPADLYTGNGAQGFEGLFFSKTRTDNRVFFVYNYCESGLYCEPLGDQTLPAQPGDAVDLIDPLVTVEAGIDLDQRIEYLDGDQTVGYFYYRSCFPGVITGEPNVDGAYGRYFMRRAGTNEFVEGVDVVFDYALREEIFSIIGTVIATN